MPCSVYALQDCNVATPVSSLQRHEVQGMVRAEILCTFIQMELDGLIQHCYCQHYARVAHRSNAVHFTDSIYGSFAGSGGPSGADVGLAAAMEEDRQAFSSKRAEEAMERQKWRSEQRETLDEMLPKATGR